jgi:hypothetical protein
MGRGKKSWHGSANSKAIGFGGTEDSTFVVSIPSHGAAQANGAFGYRSSAVFARLKLFKIQQYARPLDEMGFRSPDETRRLTDSQFANVMKELRVRVHVFSASAFRLRLTHLRLNSAS